MPSTLTRSPFDLASDTAYAHWRQNKIARHPERAEQLIVPIERPDHLSGREKKKILELCGQANMAVYQLDPAQSYSKADITSLAAQLGLKHMDCNLLADNDCITTLRHDPTKSKRGYIPYSNRRINWHTDGYYNAPDKTIFGMLLHCEQPAENGGENTVMDHEMLYILLRDQNPEHVQMLMQPDAMTIPANTEPGSSVRGEQSGPVFSVTPTGHLHMRYTARTRSIRWNENVREAAEALGKLLNSDSPWKFTLKLRKGQGLVCNNVLHTRTGFDHHIGQSERLLYRARFHDRIEGVQIDPM